MVTVPHPFAHGYAFSCHIGADVVMVVLVGRLRWPFVVWRVLVSRDSSRLRLHHFGFEWILDSLAQFYAICCFFVRKHFVLVRLHVASFACCLRVAAMLVVWRFVCCFLCCFVVGSLLCVCCFFVVAFVLHVCCHFVVSLCFVCGLVLFIYCFCCFMCVSLLFCCLFLCCCLFLMFLLFLDVSLLFRCCLFNVSLSRFCFCVCWVLLFPCYVFAVPLLFYL